MLASSFITCLISAVGLSTLSSAKYKDNNSTATTWVKNAFVEATAISGPPRV